MRGASGTQCPYPFLGLHTAMLEYFQGIGGAGGAVPSACSTLALGYGIGGAGGAVPSALRL